jgi:hypothetical protein
VSWLNPAAVVWEARFGRGTFPWPMAGRALKALQPHHEPDVIASHLDEYLDQTPPQFINLFKFAQTFGAYAPTEMVDKDGVLIERSRGRP